MIKLVISLECNIDLTLEIHQIKGEKSYDILKRRREKLDIIQHLLSSIF